MSDISIPGISRRTLMTAALVGAAGLAAPRSALAARGPLVTMLGDSITAGLGLPAAQALPAQLQAALGQLGVACVVRGAGVSGDTSAGGAARVDFSVQAPTKICIVALGGNDLLRGLDPKATRANLERIFRRLKARKISVILAGLKAPSELGRAYAGDFNAVFPAVARANGVALYPDLLAGVARNRALNQPDGLHPNAQGVRIIARGLAPLVAKAIRARG